jgi:hypothetical protein
MISWVTALIFAGGVIAAVFFARWIAWRKRRSRPAPEVRVDSAGARGDRQLMRVAYRRVFDAAPGGMEATGPERYPAAADVARRPSGASTSAHRGGQRPGGQHGTAPQAGPAITSPPDSTSAGALLHWSYQGTGSGEVAGAGNAKAADSSRPVIAGAGPPPPEVAATLRDVVSELRVAAAALPGDFAQLTGEAQIRCMAGVAKHVPGRWFPAGAVTGNLDLPAEKTNWTWTVFLEPGSTSGAQSSKTRPARSTDQAPAGHKRPDPADAGDARTDASGPGRSQTVILLDAAILDTLTAILLPGTHGVNYGDAIGAIKISIRPRMLVIKSVNLTVGAILNAHGLGVLAPAFGRITTKILVPTLNLLLGPDCRHDKLIKSLDLLDVGLYAANGRLTDSPTFRSNLSDWVAGAHGPPPRPYAYPSGSQRPRPHPGHRASWHSRRPESGPNEYERRSAPWSDTGSQGWRAYPPRTSPSSADSRADAPPRPDPATQARATSPTPTSPGQPDPVRHGVAGSAGQRRAVVPAPASDTDGIRPGAISAGQRRAVVPAPASDTDGIRPGAKSAGQRRAAGTETPGVAAPPRHDPLTSRRQRRQGPPTPMR